MTGARQPMVKYFQLQLLGGHGSGIGKRGAALGRPSPRACRNGINARLSYQSRRFRCDVLLALQRARSVYGAGRQDSARVTPLEQLGVFYARGLHQRMSKSAAWLNPGVIMKAVIHVSQLGRRRIKAHLLLVPSQLHSSIPMWVSPAIIISCQF